MIGKENQKPPFRLKALNIYIINPDIVIGKMYSTYSTCFDSIRLTKKEYMQSTKIMPNCHLERAPEAQGTHGALNLIF